MGHLCSYRIEFGNHTASEVEVEVEVGDEECLETPDLLSPVPEAVGGLAEECRFWDGPAAALHAVLSWRRPVALVQRYLGEWTRIQEDWISGGQNISIFPAEAPSLRSS